MATLVPLGHSLDAEVARKLGHALVAIYVNPETVTMVKPSNENPNEESVVHFVNGQTLPVVENFGEVASKLSYPRGANRAFFREIWIIIRDSVQEEERRATLLNGILRVFKESGMSPESVLGVHDEIDHAVQRLGEVTIHSLFGVPVSTRQTKR